MEERIINFSANQQSLIKTGGISHYASDTVSYIKAIFELGENWTGFDEVRAVFKTPYDTRVAVLNSLGECEVPHEILMLKADVRVNLVGSIYTEEAVIDRLTTYSCEALTVDEDVPVEGRGTITPTPSEYEQFVAKVKEDADRAEAGATASEQSAQNASDSATSAHNSAESARDDKITIEQAIAEVIQQIEGFEQVQVVVNTLPPTSPATSDFTDGVLTLGIPQGVKGDTGNGIQSITKTGTSGLVDTYTITFTDGQTTTFNVTNGAKGDTGNGISSIEKTSTVGLVDTYTITYTNGTTTTFTVANGEKGDKGDTGEVSLSELEDATIVQTLSDSEPYNYRRTNNGNGSGTREYDEIVGASVGWNQLVPTDKRDFTNSSTDSRALKFVFCKSASPYTQLYTENVTATGLICGIVSASFSGNAYFIHSGNERNINITGYDDIELQNGHKYYFSINFTGIDPSTVGGLSSKDLMLTDLTLFNSAIADYVYSLEQSTAGSGVAWLKSHFPKLFDNGYQPFDSGSIKSVSGLTAHEMVGKNLVPENGDGWFSPYGNISSTFSGGVWTITNTHTSGRSGRIAIGAIPSGTYYLSFKSLYHTGALAVFRTSDNVRLSQTTSSLAVSFTINEPTDVYIMSAGFEPGTCTITNLMLSLASDEIYEPYTEHAYPLDSSVTLRGQYKLDANNQLYADGDVYASDGTVTRKYGVVDLGTLSWVYDSTNQAFYSPSVDKANGFQNIVCDKYATRSSNSGSNWNLEDKSIGGGSNSYYIYIKDSAYSDSTSFKSALNGVHAIFEVATPTAETATPYTSPQWCDSKGTEEYVGSELPVGHNTDYPMTMVDCADGLSNGTYTPKLTVTNGKLTFEWQSV